MERKPATLKRELGLLAVFCIASGAMISSGLFILPAIVFLRVGPATLMVYVLAGIFMLPSILSKIELATAMPKSGGSYFFIERSMGPLPGTLTGLANWLSISLKTAFALVGIGAFITLFYPGVSYVFFQTKNANYTPINHALSPIDHPYPFCHPFFCILFWHGNRICVGQQTEN